MKIKLSHYKFDIPEELIAQYPTQNRDESRLMVVHKDTGKIEHKMFKDLLDVLDEDDLLITNNTRIFPARLYGNKEKTDAAIEVYLLRELNPDNRLWDVMVDPARKIRVGNKLYFGDDELVAEVIDNTTSRGRTIRFIFDGTNEEFKEVLHRIGKAPVPAYLRRPPEEGDLEWYQSIFATTGGSISSPSAGLHFTKPLVMRLGLKGVKIEPLTLHQGYGTFRLIEVEDITKHKMDSEYYNFPKKTSDEINIANKTGKRVIGVGASTLRVLESSITSDYKSIHSEGWTDKFIYPPHEFKVATGVLTNFQYSQSTYFMTPAAFLGVDKLKEVYREAIKEKYRFLCYGDALLVI